MHLCSFAGKDWTLDTDFEAAGQQIQRGYLSMLAIDSLLAFMGSVEKLTDYALDLSDELPAALSKWPGSGQQRGKRGFFGGHPCLLMCLLPPGLGCISFWQRWPFVKHCRLLVLLCS